MNTQNSVDFKNAEKSMSSKRPAENNLFPPSKKQKTIFSYTEKKSQQQMYAELAAVDRLSFLQIANSTFIHNSMLKDGLQSHPSHETVKNKVFQYSDFLK